MIELKNIHVEYDKVVFDNANIELKEHQFNILTGASGTGKTTLLSLLGLLQECQGCYSFDNHILDYKKNGELYRKYKIGFVFQENHLLKKLTVEENLCFAAYMSGIKIDEQELKELYSLTSIEHLIKRNVSSLSGGERQRVAIAFALVKKPRLLLLDEPTSFLDIDNALMVIQILKNIISQTNTIVLLTSHDQRIIQHANVIFTIQNHKIICQNKNTHQKRQIDKNAIHRNKDYTKKAFQQYIEISRKKNNKIIYFCLTVIFTIFFFGTGYHIYYNDYITENFINSSLEEVRIYYGPNRQFAFNDISDTISNHTLNKIKQIDGVKNLIPFYEIEATCQDDEILIQTYFTMDDKKIKTKYDNDGEVYISYNISKLMENENISFFVGDKEYQLKISGILNKDVKNNYSRNGEKIIYVKEELFNDIIDYQENSLLYIMSFKNNANLKTIKERVKKIDKDLTYYSTVDINKLCLLNEQLLEGIETLVKVMMIFILVIVIYDKQKYLKERENEFILLYANGMSSREFHCILYKDSYLYDIASIFIGCLTAIILLNIFYEFYNTILFQILLLGLFIYIVLVTVNYILESYIFNHLSFKEL